MDRERVKLIKEIKEKSGPVLYWMSRDQRVEYNWALLFAQELAIERREPMAVVFCLVPEFLGATIRHYGFMIKGLIEVEKRLKEKDIAFYLLRGLPEDRIPGFIRQYGISSIVTDFDPLRIKRKWQDAVSKKTDISYYLVDAHNIVPCWTASDKQEFSAHTIRGKIRRLLPRYLNKFPELKRHPVRWRDRVDRIDWATVLKSLKVNRDVPEIRWLEPGERGARENLKKFLETKIHRYDKERNNPIKDGQSNLSPYLHFGQISAQYVALEAKKNSANKGSKEAFLDELVVRRELSDNFCYYNKRYDSVEGFHKWAKDTLKQHARDKREYLYRLDRFEYGKTHDDLWNAAQLEMVIRGKMHGYMRMYWGKKILEWTKDPEDALRVAIYLNDKYELDGRDPNGYVGVAWSIGGVHDRPWPSHQVFGKIRYMSYNGCKSKFDVESYIRKNKNIREDL